MPCNHGVTLWRSVLMVSILTCSACAWLDLQQRQLIYRPTPSLSADLSDLRAGDERYFVTVPNTDPAAQRVSFWWLPQADRNAPTLLYFHGTFRTLAENRHKLDALRQAGFAVLGVDYRGWGLSTPITPSEKTIQQDAEVAWAELQRREPRAAQRVIYGHSMGSGVAVDLASRLHAPADYGALIPESAFTSFPDVAREAGLWARLLAWFNQERFDSLDKITRVQAPLLMIHGNLDTTIPLSLGASLFAAAKPPKQWLTIEGGAHSDLNQVNPAAYQGALQGFISKHLTSPP
jgi:alpha-beta hydrolase superfamily lysophospholipase